MSWNDDVTPDAVRGVVGRHLDAEAAAAYLAAGHPALRLVPAAEDEQVVARLGGAPVVPDGWQWPTEPEPGPLSFVGEVDLDAVARAGLDVSDRLPAVGRLLIFHAEGDFAGAETADPVDGGPWNPGERRAARLLHVTEPRAACREQAVPSGTPVRPATILAGRPITTWPSIQGAAGERLLRELAVDDGTAYALEDELADLHGEEPQHRVGGWARSLGIPPEEAVEGEGEGDEWHLLVQVDTLPPSTADALDWAWGDLGTISWLAPVSADPADAVDRWEFTLDF